MALFSGTGRFSLIQSYDLRKVREKSASSVLNSEFKAQKPGPSERRTLIEQESTIERVSVYSEKNTDGKVLFSVVLELDPDLNPSNRTRRTETVKGLALDVEEKELPSLCRLSGRKLEILVERWNSDLDFEKLLSENQALRAEIEELKQRKKIISDQLHFAMESLRRAS